MSRWFLFAARGRTGSSCLAIGARPGLVVEDLDLFLKLVPVRDASFREKSKGAECESEPETSTHTTSHRAGRSAVNRGICVISSREKSKKYFPRGTTRTINAR